MELDTLNPLTNIIISSPFPPIPLPKSSFPNSDINSNSYVKIKSLKERRHATHVTCIAKEISLLKHMANNSNLKTNDKLKSTSTSSTSSETCKKINISNDDPKPERTLLKRLRYDESIDLITYFQPREAPVYKKKATEGPSTKFRKVGEFKKLPNISTSQSPLINESLNKLLLTHIPLSSSNPRFSDTILLSSSTKTQSIRNTDDTNTINCCLSSIAEIESLFNLSDDNEHYSFHTAVEFSSDLHNKHESITPLCRNDLKTLNDLEKVREFLRKLSSWEQPFGYLSIEGKIMTNVMYTLINMIQLDVKSLISKNKTLTTTTSKLASLKHKKSKNAYIQDQITCNSNNNPLRKKQLMSHKKKSVVSASQHKEITHMLPMQNNDPPVRPLEKDIVSIDNNVGEKDLQKLFPQFIKPGHEINFPRHVFGSIDRREAINEHFFINLKDSDKIVSFCKVEIFLNPSTYSRWIDALEIPINLELNQNIQIASKKSGIPHRFWRDAKIININTQEILASIKLANQEIKNITLKSDDFIPPRYPCLEPSKGSWRLRPKFLSPSTDLYIGACICVSSVDSPYVLNDCVVQGFYFDEKHVPRRRSRPVKSLSSNLPITGDTKDNIREATNNSKLNSVEDKFSGIIDTETSVNATSTTIKGDPPISLESQVQANIVKEGQMPQDKVSWIKIFYLASRKEELLAVNELLRYKMPYDLQPHLEDTSTKTATLKSLNSTMFWTLPRYSQIKNLESDSNQILKLGPTQSEPSHVSLSQFFKNQDNSNSHTHFIIYISLGTLSNLPKKSFSKLVHFLHPELYNRPKDFWLQASWLNLFNPQDDFYCGIHKPKPYWETSHKRDDNNLETRISQSTMNDENSDGVRNPVEFDEKYSESKQRADIELKNPFKKGHHSSSELIIEKELKIHNMHNSIEPTSAINIQKPQINQNNNGYSCNNMSEIYDELNFSPLEDNLPVQKYSPISSHEILDDFDIFNKVDYSNTTILNQTEIQTGHNESTCIQQNKIGLPVESSVKGDHDNNSIEDSYEKITNPSNPPRDTHVRRSRRFKPHKQDSILDEKHSPTNGTNIILNGKIESHIPEYSIPTPQQYPPVELATVSHSHEMETRLLKIQWDEDIELS